MWVSSGGLWFSPTIKKHTFKSVALKIFQQIEISASEVEEL